jgi:hypothetical protein
VVKFSTRTFSYFSGHVCIMAHVDKEKIKLKMGSDPI